MIIEKPGKFETAGTPVDQQAERLVEAGPNVPVRGKHHRLCGVRVVPTMLISLLLAAPFLIARAVQSVATVGGAPF